jgi:hypothetical protein
MIGRGQVYVPLQLSDLREILKDPGSYIDAPDQYIQAFISVIQTFELTLKDIMLLLEQTLSSLEEQQVLAQATQVGNDYHLQWAPIPMVPGNEEINMLIPKGHRQSPWQIHTGIKIVRKMNGIDATSSIL